MDSEEIETRIRIDERRHIVGIVLRAYAEAKLAGEQAIADALGRLATDIEHEATGKEGDQ